MLMLGVYGFGFMSMEFEHRSAIIVRTIDVACLMWSVTLK